MAVVRQTCSPALQDSACAGVRRIHFCVHSPGALWALPLSLGVATCDQTCDASNNCSTRLYRELRRPGQESRPSPDASHHFGGVLCVLLRSRNLPHCVLHFTENYLSASGTHALGVAWGIKVLCDGFCLASTAPRLPDTDQIFWAVLLGCISVAAYEFCKTLGNVYQFCENMWLDSHLLHKLYHHARRPMAAVASHGSVLCCSVHTDKEQAKPSEIEEAGKATGGSQQAAAPALQLGDTQEHVQGSSSVQRPVKASSNAADSPISNAARPDRSNRGSKATHYVSLLAQPSHHININAHCSLGTARRMHSWPRMSASASQHTIQLGAAVTNPAEQGFHRRGPVDNAQGKNSLVAGHRAADMAPRTPMMPSLASVMAPRGPGMAPWAPGMAPRALGMAPLAPAMHPLAPGMVLQAAVIAPQPPLIVPQAPVNQEVHTGARHGRGTDDMVGWRSAPLGTTKRVLQKFAKDVKSRVSRESQDQCWLPYGSNGVLPQRRNGRLEVKKVLAKCASFGASRTV